MMVPFGPSAAAADEFTAWFGAQMDPINGWDDLGDAAIASFKLNEEVTISIDFTQYDEVDGKVSFGDGNYIAIETNVPNQFAGMPLFQNPALAEVLSFKLDGNEVEMDDVYLNAEGKKDINDEGMGMRLTLCNKWSPLEDEQQPVDPLTLGEFENLEITFIVRGPYFAQLDAYMESDLFDDDYHGWALGRAAQTGFLMGHPAVIEIEFDDLVTFGEGHYIAINTNLPNPFDGEPIFADPGMAQILSFKLDDVEIDRGDVLLNAEGMDAIDSSSTGLRLTLTNKWNPEISEQPLDPEGLGEFTKLRVEFIVNYVGEPPEPPAIERPDLSNVTGLAYIGGTFVFLDSDHPLPGEDPDRCDWWPFDDQTVDIKIGEPFVVSIDMGSEKIKHTYAHWNGEDYIVAVDTDIEMSPIFFDAYIDYIKVDGRDIIFNDGVVAVGTQEHGTLRVSITNSWAEAQGNPVPIEGPNAIGEFSKLEIRMVIVPGDDPNPFGGGDSGGDDPVPPPPPIEKPPEEPKQTSWLIWALIAGGVVIVGAVIAIVVVVSKKKKG